MMAIVSLRVLVSKGEKGLSSNFMFVVGISKRLTTIALCCLIGCSATQAGELRGWEKYSGPVDMRGLHLKPIEVVFGRQGVVINQQVTTVEDAFRLLKESQSLSPLPDVLVGADRSRSMAATRFMKQVSDADLCEDRKCFYRF